MTAPARIHDDERTCSHIIILEDPEVVRLERRLALLSGFYERRVMPTLIGSASILAAVVVIAQITKWILR